MEEKSVKRLNFNVSMEMYDWLKETSDRLNIPVSAIVIMSVHNFRSQEMVLPHLADLARLERETE